MSNMRKTLVEALKLHAEAHVKKHLANIENLLENPVGIGEHGDLVSTIEHEIEEVAKYDDQLEVIKKYL